jgi:hypothetical protein
VKNGTSMMVVLGLRWRDAEEGASCWGGSGEERASCYDLVVAGSSGGAVLEGAAPGVGTSG